MGLYKQPTKTAVIIFISLWLLASTILIWAASSGFTKSPFQGMNILYFLLIIGSSGSVIRLVKNYRKQKE